MNGLEAHRYWWRTAGSRPFSCLLWDGAHILERTFKRGRNRRRRA
jgi:hypothetical protein